MALTYLGIDPGLNGSFVLIAGNHVSLMFTMPTTISLGGKARRDLDIYDIASFLRSLPRDTHVAIEDQPPVRNQSIISTCTTQRNYGILLCTLTLCHRDYIEVSSSDWQSHFGITPNRDGKKGKTTKQQAAEVAQSRFPDTDFRASNRAKKPHEGLIDACLLSLYLKEKEIKEKEKKENE